MDDAYYIKFPPDTIHYFLRNSHAIIAGSHELLRYSQLFNKTGFFSSSPVIDHKRRKVKRNPVFTIGWIGFFNAHRESILQLFLPALLDLNLEIKLIFLGITSDIHKMEIREYLKNNAERRLFYEVAWHLGASQTDIALLTAENIDWQDEIAVYERICEFDMGIAPLIDNEINRAKSAFKLKQYLSCGIPVAGSKVGENIAVIEEGVNGFFCDLPEDYLRMILFFNQLPEDKYQWFSDNAKRTSEHFSMENYCSHYMDYFESATG